MAETASEPSWLTGLDFVITDAPAGGGAAAPGAGAMPNGGAPPGGRFSLSREEAQSMLTVAKRVRDDLTKLKLNADRLLRLTPPADDPGSKSYNQALVGDGTGSGALPAGEAMVARERDYAVQLVDRLEDALGLTHSSDEQAATDVKTAAGQGQDEGLAG